MPRYVALLRGINVGGNTMIKMSELKAAFEECGFENVVTYINSGNIAFDVGDRVSSSHVSTGSIANESTLVTNIEQTIEKEFGKSVRVMVREQNAIVDILENNPFEGQFESHKEMHVLFLKEPLTDERIELLRAMAPTQERFVAEGREIYCHLPLGVADSFLGRGQFEKKLKVSTTARNWRTVEKLAGL